jgi:hypothetical protein
VRQLTALLQDNGLSQVQLIELMDFEQLKGSLRLAQHFAAAEFSDVTNIPSPEPSLP